MGSEVYGLPNRVHHGTRNWTRHDPCKQCFQGDNTRSIVLCVFVNQGKCLLWKENNIVRNSVSHRIPLGPSKLPSAQEDLECNCNFLPDNVSGGLFHNPCFVSCVMEMLRNVGPVDHHGT